MDDSELESIYRDDAFKPKEEIKIHVEEKPGAFDHSGFGRILIDMYHIKNLNDQFFVYEDGYYKLGTNIVERKMIDLMENIKSRQRNEVWGYIKIKTQVSSDIVNLILIL